MSSPRRDGRFPLALTNIFNTIRFGATDGTTLTFLYVVVGTDLARQSQQQKRINSVIDIYLSLRPVALSSWKLIFMYVV